MIMYYINMYLDWVNNFLTLDAFCEYYDMEPREARRVLEIGKEMNMAMAAKAA
jgi:hypothetical protein